MEDTHWDFCAHSSEIHHAGVLILVLMEDTHWGILPSRPGCEK